MYKIIQVPRSYLWCDEYKNIYKKDIQTKFSKYNVIVFFKKQ